MRNKYIIFMILMLLIPMVLAETEVYPINEDVELKFICTSGGEIPTSATFNITISYPNGSTFINNKQTTSLGNGAFSYSINFPILGNYPVQMFCYDGADSYSNTGNYEITNDGKIRENGVYIAIWLSCFILVYFVFIYRKSIPLYRVFGHVIIFLNGLLGVFIFDNPLILIIMFSSLIFMFKGFIEFSHEIFNDTD